MSANLFVSNLLARFAAGPRAQRVYDRLHAIALAGMNVGGATRRLQDSGELAALRYARSNLLAAVDRPVVFDVGAHKGQYAEAAIDIFGERALVFAFEPVGRVFQRLQTRLAERPQARLFQVALSDHDAELTMYFDPDSVIPSALPDAEDLAERDLEQETVPAIRLDRFCEEQNIERIHFLKLDVEGWELKVLQGANGMLGRNAIDVVQFEFGSYSIAARTFFKDFFDLLHPTHELFRVLPNALDPIPSYSARREIFVSASNYLAVRRGLPRAG